MKIVNSLSAVRDGFVETRKNTFLLVFGFPILLADFFYAGALFLLFFGSRIDYLIEALFISSALFWKKYVGVFLIVGFLKELFEISVLKALLNSSLYRQMKPFAIIKKTFGVAKEIFFGEIFFLLIAGSLIYSEAFFFFIIDKNSAGQFSRIIMFFETALLVISLGGVLLLRRFFYLFLASTRNSFGLLIDLSYALILNRKKEAVSFFLFMALINVGIYCCISWIDFATGIVLLYFISDRTIFSLIAAILLLLNVSMLSFFVIFIRASWVAFFKQIGFNKQSGSEILHENVNIAALENI